MAGGRVPSILNVPGGVISEVCTILDAPTQHNWMTLVDYLPGYIYKDVVEIRTQAQLGRSPSRELLIELNGQGFNIIDLAKAAKKAGIVSIVEIISKYCEEEDIKINLEQTSPAGWIAARHCHQRQRYPTELVPPTDMEAGYRRYGKPPPPPSACTMQNGRSSDSSTSGGGGERGLPPACNSSTSDSGNSPVCNSNSVGCTDAGGNSSPTNTSNALFSPPPPLPSSLPLSSSFEPPLTPAGLEEIEYEVLKEATNQFDETPGGHKVGAGGFGVVFECFLELKRKRVHAAVKVLLNNTDTENSATSAGSVDSVDRQQFSTEIQSLSKLSHECLLPVLAYSCNGPKLCLVYSFMSNGSLDTHLPNETTLSSLGRVRIACDVASALHYLHSVAENVVVHRDIKSANILLSEDWRGKLGDFGLARSLPTFKDGSTLITTTIMGTHLYMAPEATRGTITPKADVYAFGIVLYELLTGKCALSKLLTESGDETDLVTYIQDHEDELTDLLIGEWDLNVQDELWLLAERCLLPQRRKRPSSTEIYDKLKSLI